MSGSLTVIGGHAGGTLSGLVAVPIDQSSLTLSELQTDFSALSNDVLLGTEILNSVRIIGISNANYAGSDTPALLELTNTYTTGATVAGSAAFSTAVPSGYNALVVQAPGAETVAGNGSTGFLAVFGAQSSVSFNSNGGAGTVVASGGDFINVSGTYANNGWSVASGASGADTINTTAENTALTIQGAGDVVGLGGIFSTVLAAGSNAVIVGYGGLNTISVTGAGDNLLISGGADTVYAMSGSSALNMFFFGTGDGGKLDFVNNSGFAASVSGGANGGSSGSVTVFGGTGGGYYQGGVSGNNSLIGGTGTAAATLIGGGNNNVLSVDGSGANALFAGDGTATLVAGAGTGTNLLEGGGGTDSIVSYGAGTQSFFVGNGGTETLTGSTATGAVNNYYFQQNSLQGGGTDFITDFRVSADQGYVDPFASGDGVIITSVQSEMISSLVSSQINLSDNTSIKLIGVTFTAAELASIVGGTSF